MTDYKIIFELLGLLGFVVAVIAEIDISLHRRYHERRQKARRVGDPQ